MSYKEFLSQDQGILRARIFELMEGRSVMAMGKLIGMPYSSFRRWLLGEDLRAYKPLFKIVSFLEKHEAASKNKEPATFVEGQTKIK